MPTKPKREQISYRPLTPDHWPDLERLFGPRGACGGCWCMWWRLSHSEYERRKGAANKRAFKKLVASGAEPGVIAYRDDQPVGWCAVQPRGEYPRLARSRILKPVDERPVWSVVCLFVVKELRRSGISIKLLRSAVDHARKRGARIVEGYPVEPRKPDIADVFAACGTASAFRRAGFTEVARRSETRPIMRIYLPR